MKHYSNYLAMLTLFSTPIIASEFNNRCCNQINNVCTDSPPYTIETQFRGLWLKPNTNNLYYAAEAFPFNESLPVPIASPNWKIFDCILHIDLDLISVCDVYCTPEIPIYGSIGNISNLTPVLHT